MKPKTIKIIATILTVAVGLMIIGGGIAMIAGMQGATKDLIGMGVGNYLRLLGVMHILFAILFVYPKTFKLGFILLSCYLAGAIATELSHGQKLEAVFPLALVWVTTFLRDRSVFFPTSKVVSLQKEEELIDNNFQKNNEIMNYLELKKTDWVSVSGLWLGRIVLAYMTFIFIMVGLRGLLHPVASAAEFGISLGSPTGITVVRVAFGGFPLATAILTLMSLIFPKQMFNGLILTAMVVGVLTIVRIYGVAIDGMTAWNMKVLKPEIVITVLSIVAIIFEMRRHKRLK